MSSRLRSTQAFVVAAAACGRSCDEVDDGVNEEGEGEEEAEDEEAVAAAVAATLKPRRRFFRSAQPRCSGASTTVSLSSRAWVADLMRPRSSRVRLRMIFNC